jgi:hypothetical protein
MTKYHYVYVCIMHNRYEVRAQDKQVVKGDHNKVYEKEEIYSSIWLHWVTLNISDQLINEIKCNWMQLWTKLCSIQ